MCAGCRLCALPHCACSVLQEADFLDAPGTPTLGLSAEFISGKLWCGWQEGREARGVFASPSCWASERPVWSPGTVLPRGSFSRHTFRVLFPLFLNFFTQAYGKAMPLPLPTSGCEITLVASVHLHVLFGQCFHWVTNSTPLANPLLIQGLVFIWSSCYWPRFWYLMSQCYSWNYEHSTINISNKIIWVCLS